MKKYVFKPLDQIHAYVLVLFLCIMPPLGLMSLFLRHDQRWLITVMVMYGVEFLVFLCVRLFYSVRYVVDDSYLVKYCGKKIVFKVKKSDIKKVYIKKADGFPFSDLYGIL